MLGPLLAIVYKETSESKSLSIILIGRHGVFGSTNITLDSSSRYYGACLNLPMDQRNSAVRKALAIGCLRTFACMDPALKTYLTSSVKHQDFDWDETTAGTLASSLKPALGKFPNDIGNAVINSGILQQKSIKVVIIDIVYKNLREFNLHNDKLVNLFGNQLDNLFDPLAEYSPEPTELLYSSPSRSPSSRRSDDTIARNICHELLTVQSRFSTNLFNFLQDYLIPLRVKVLGGEIPGLNTQIINTIFPPTIDEVARVNNILFDALSKSIENGSYETIKACGVSVPYFYKACMRHEAATKNFTQNLRNYMSLIQRHAPFVDKFTINRIESIINCSLHLTKIKLILDRLVGSVNWSASEKVSVFQFYESAVGTIHSFGQESSILPYDSRVFTSNGRLLVELSKGWPKELEYGWINRRVVTIFDAFDVTSGDDKSLNLVFVFNDSVVILKPVNPVRSTSECGLDEPSIADIIMHSMINSVPLPELCKLDVIGWAPIEDVYMSEFGTFDLSMYITGAGLLPGLTQAIQPRYCCIFKLIHTKLNASTIARDISKAKILNKTEQFHLFYNKQPNFTTFGAVYEATHHKYEIHKSPIALYINMPMPDCALDDQNIKACIKATFYGRDHVGITIKSKMNYNIHEIVPKQRFSIEISKHISHLYNLLFVSSNTFTMEMAIQNNASLASYLITYANTRRQYPKNTKTTKSPKPGIYSSSTFVTSPAPNQAVSFRQRVSSSSSVLTKLSQKFSQEALHRKPSDSMTDSKKRFSISSFLRDKSPKLDGSATAGFEEAEMPKILPTNTVCSLTERVKEKPNTVQNRYSFPFVTEIPTVSKAAPKIGNSTVSEPKIIMEESPNFDVCEKITTSRPGSIVQTSKTFARKISASVPSTFSSKKESKLPNYSHVSLSKPAMPGSNRKDIGAVKVTSSSVVKDSESFICGTSSVAPSIDMALKTKSPSNSAFASATIPSVGVYHSIGQTPQRTSSQLSERGAQSISSSGKNWYTGLIHENSAESLETDYTSMTETSFDEESITKSAKTITSFLDTSTVSSHYQPPRVMSAETVPQLPPIIFDDSDSLLDLVAPHLLPPTPFESERKRQHKRVASTVSDDWQTISDEVSSLHIYHHHRKFSASASLKEILFANTLSELTTTENYKHLDFVQRTVDHLQATTRSLSPMPCGRKLTKHDQDRIICVESSNRTILMSCFWTLLAEKRSGPAVQQFLMLEWERRSLMRQKLGEAKPIQLWKV